MRKILIGLLIVIVAASSVSGCGKKDSDRGKAQMPIPVKVMKVKLDTLSLSLEYVGNIKGIDEAIVYPKVNGKIVEKVKEDGSLVVKGEAIAYIDRDEPGLKFEKAPVDSPLAGTVGRVYVDIGSNVTILTPIALVANMDKAQIDLDIPEKYLPRMRAGQEARITVDAYPGEKFIGRVVKISPVCDLQTRSAPIEIDIDNPSHRLQSGMFAKVSLIIEETANVPVIPKESIIGKAPETYVYIVEDKRAVLKKVILGMRQGPYYEVKDGLNEGDLTVVMGQQRLRDGAWVEAEE